MSTRYAVVDLETTGPKVKEGDRIIQIGAVFLEEGKRVEEYATNVNPLQPLSEHVSNLTGIQDEDLAGAPLFEELAEVLWQKLQGCVFVAHNLQFDYNFLSHSFEAVGLPPLNLRGIDTVELVRLFYPQAKSYRLGDFCKAHGISLEHAHTAIEDAGATASLLELVHTKIAQFPESLYQQLKPFLAFLSKDCQDFVDACYAQNLSVKKKEGGYDSPFTFRKDLGNFTVYPQSTPSVSSRFLEVEKVYQNIALDSQNFFEEGQGLQVIQADSGLGKSFNVTLGALRSSCDRVVLSLPNNFLGEDWVKNRLPDLAAQLGREVKYTFLKSAKHYVNLASMKQFIVYAKSNYSEINKQEAHFIVAVLVWLFETKTGEKSELNWGLFQSKLWDKIDQQEEAYDFSKEDFGEYDFERRPLQAAKDCELIITNHAYLNQYVDWLKQEGWVNERTAFILDECHRLPKVYQTNHQISFDISQMERYLRGQNQLLSQTLRYPFSDEHSLVFYQWESSYQKVLLLLDALTDDLEKLLDRAEADKEGERVVYCSYEQMTLSAHWLDLVDFWQEFCRLIWLSKDVFKAFRSQIEEKKSRWTQWEKNLSLGQRLVSQLEDLVTLDDHYFFVVKQESLISAAGGHLLLMGSLTNPREQLGQWLRRLGHRVALVSATPAEGMSVEQLESYYGITGLKAVTYPSYYDYDRQIRAVVLKDQPSLPEVDEEEASQLVCRVLTFLQEHQKGPIQVFFQSKAFLRQVFEFLEKEWEDEPLSHVYRQKEKASRIRLFNRFKQDEKGILLGTASFAEGVHLNRGIAVYVLTRLPFQSPEEVYQKAWQDYYQAHEGNYFKEEALKEMLISLKQILGRLLNQPVDYSLFISLDKRIIASPYAKIIQEALPEGLTFEEVSLEELEDKQ